MKNEIKTVPYRTLLGMPITVYFQFHKYSSNGNTAIWMICRDEQLGDEPWSFLTVNLDEKLPENMAYIDINNNGDSVLDWLEENGFAQRTGSFRQSGWCIYPLVCLNMDRLKEYGCTEEELGCDNQEA